MPTELQILEEQWDQLPIKQIEAQVKALLLDAQAVLVPGWNTLLDTLMNAIPIEPKYEIKSQ